MWASVPTKQANRAPSARTMPSFVLMENVVCLSASVPVRLIDQPLKKKKKRGGGRISIMKIVFERQSESRGRGRTDFY